MYPTANKTAVTQNAPYAKQIAVSDEQQSLADYVREKVRASGLSYRKIAARSGGRISPTAISDIIKGKYSNVSAETLAALADGLNVPFVELSVIAGKATEGLTRDEFLKSLAYDLYKKSKSASPTKQAFVEGVMRMTLREIEEEKEDRE